MKFEEWLSSQSIETRQRYFTGYPKGVWDERGKIADARETELQKQNGELKDRLRSVINVIDGWGDLRPYDDDGDEEIAMARKALEEAK